MNRQKAFQIHLYFMIIGMTACCLTIYTTVFVYNLKTHRIEKNVTLSRNIINNLLHVDANGYIYVQNGESSILIYDSEFKLISKHKLKGYILHFSGYAGNDDTGNPRFITETEDEKIIRCYEICF